MQSTNEVRTAEEAAVAAVAAALAEEEARAEYGAWLVANPAPVREFFATVPYGANVRGWIEEAGEARQRCVVAVRRAVDARRVLIARVAAEEPVDLHCFTAAFVELAVEVGGAPYTVIVSPPTNEAMIVAGH